MALSPYQKNLWKNYVNVDNPGTFITSTKMNNIETGLEGVTKEVVRVIVDGSRPQANTPILTDLVAEVNIENILFTITGVSVERELLLIVKLSDDVLADKGFNITASAFYTQLEIPLASMPGFSGRECKCYIKNFFDDSISEVIKVVIPTL